MPFLNIYPSWAKWYGIPDGSSSSLSQTIQVNYGIAEDRRYFLFRNISASQTKYAVSTNIYRHIYALGNLYVLDMSTIVNGMMCYVRYDYDGEGVKSDGFEYIYYTHKYGWVTVKRGSFLGYSPIEYKNDETGKFEGNEFYVITGISNDREVIQVSVITLTPRGSWIEGNGTTSCPGKQTGYMCWCGFVSETEEKVGKYNKVDTCKSVGASYYPMSDVDDDVFVVGTSCWKNEEHGIEIFYGISGTTKHNYQNGTVSSSAKSYYGKGFSIVNGRINAVITVDSKTREYMSDITTEEIKAEEDIVLFDTKEHGESINVQFYGYIDSGMKIPFMLGQAAIWR